MGINEYDDMMGSSQGPEASDSANEYDSLIGGEREQRRANLQQSMTAAAATEPDRAARVVKLAKEVGLDTATVSRKLEDVERESYLANNDYDRMMDETPGLSKWLENPDNASVGRDDLDALGRIDKAVRIIPKRNLPNPIASLPGELHRAGETGWNNLTSSSLALGSAFGLGDRSTIEMQAMMNKRSQELRDKMPVYAKEFNRTMEEEGKDVNEAYRKFVGSYYTWKDGRKLEALKQFISGDIERAVEVLDFVKSAMVRPRGLLYSITENALNSLPAIGGSIAGGAVGNIPGLVAGGFMGSALTEVGSEVNQSLTEKGYDITNPDDLERAYSNPQIMSDIRVRAAKKGITTAAVDAIFSAFAGKALSKVGKTATVAKKAKAAATDIGVETVGEVVGEGVGQYAREDGDLSKIDFAGAIQEGITSLGQSAATATAGASMRKAFNKDPLVAIEEVATTTDQALETLQTVQVLGELGAAVKESSTAKVLPEKVAELVDVAAGGQEASAVYFQADDWDNYWKKKGTSPIKAAEQILGDNGQSYLEAKNSNGMIEIPLSKYVAGVAPTEDFEGLLPLTRTTPDGMTFSEAREHLNTLPATMNEIAQEATAAEEQLVQEAEPDEARPTVKSMVLERLRSVGMPASEAESNAQLYESFFNTAARRLGADPVQLFESYNLRVNRREAPSGDPAAMNQDENQLVVPTQEEARPHFETEDAVERYAALPDTMGGKRIDTDAARSLHPQYASGREGAILSLDATDFPASDFAQRLYEQKLQEEHDGGYVHILAGGSGSGKTRHQSNFEAAIESADVILDTTSANYDLTKKRIDQALESDRNVVLTYVYRPFPHAVQGVKERFHKTGRIVTPDYLAYTHTAAMDNVIRLAEEYKDNPNVTIEAIDNSREKPRSLSIEKLKALRYNSGNETVEETRARLERFANEQLKNELQEIAETKSRASGQNGPRSGEGEGVSGGDGEGSGGTGRTFNQSALSQVAPTGPTQSPLGFYSQVEAEIQKMDFKQMPGKDLAGRIKNIQGIKKEELEFLGLIDWLETQESKVSKEQVLEFVRGNGLIVDQLVLSEDHSGTAGSVQDMTWSEPERDDSNNDDVIYDETRYYLHESDWADERKEELRNELIEEHTDEDGEVDESALDTAIKARLEEEAEAMATEDVESDDWSGARFTVTGTWNDDQSFELYGSDEIGWYSNDLRQDLGYDLNEAKIKLMAGLNDKGLIEIDSADLSREEDLSFGSPRGESPSNETLKRKTRALIKKDKQRFLRQARLDFPREYENKTPEEIKRADEINLEYFARQEIEDGYNNVENSRNKIRINISHPILKGDIKGNNIKGWVLEIYGVRNWNLTAKSVEAAQEETRQILIKEKLLAAKAQSSDRDINESIGSSRFESYIAPGPSENYREILLTLPSNRGGEFVYSTHFSQRNVVAHARITDRIDAAGKKTLFVEEVQSDWHQQGRDKGYLSSDKETLANERRSVADQIEEIEQQMQARKNELMVQADDKVAEYRRLAETDQTLADLSDKQSSLEERQRELAEMSGGVADAPLKNTEAWASLVMKRMIRLAVEQGYDSVTWSPASFQVDRWGTDDVTWVKKTRDLKVVAENGEYIIKEFDPDTGKVVSESFSSEFNTREEAEAEAEKFRSYWLVGSIEQRGGRAGDVENIEELARMRGDLLERRGEKVNTKEELYAVVASTLGRERTKKDLDNLTNNIWEQMQIKETGVKAPRKEGMEFFYDNVLPKKVASSILKKLDKNAKVSVTKIRTHDSGGLVPSKYEGPELTIDQVDEIRQKASNDDEVSVRTAIELKDLAERLRDGVAFADAANSLSSSAAEYIGGKLVEDSGQTESDVWQIELTPTIREKALEGFSLFQGDPNSPLGQIRFGEAGINIDLLKSANPSTFLHETGHFYLEVMGDIASREDAPQQVKDDYQAILEFLGVESRDQIGVEQHEKWARSFEAYLFEGKAPSMKLRQAFHRFRMWLVSVYRQLRNLRVELTPEVRDVMNRMLATEDEIATAMGDVAGEFFGKDPAQFGLTGEKAERYMRARAEWRQVAEDELSLELMAGYLQTKETEYKERRAAVKAEVEAQANEMLVFKAISLLQNGKMPDGSDLPPGVEQIKLDRADLVKSYGEEIVKRLPVRVVAPRGSTGVEHNLAAGMLGFESGEQLVLMLANSPKKSEFIEFTTEARMKTEYPDLIDDSLERLHAEAVDFVHNEMGARVKRMELEHLASNDMPVLKDTIRQVARRIPSEKQVREQAERAIGAKRVADLSPHIFRQAERKAARQAGEALARGDFDKAFEFKQKELYNYELYRAALRAQKELQKSLQNFKKIMKPDEKLSKTRDVDIVNAARAVMAEFGIGRSDRTADDFLKKIAAYDPDGYQTISALVQSATAGARNYKDVRFDDFIAMRDSVMALWDLAKTSMEIEIDGKIRHRDDVIAELSNRLGEISGSSERAGYDRAASRWEKFKMDMVGWRAALRRVESWVDAVDGLKSKVFRTNIWNPVSEAVNKYRIEKTKYLRRFLELADGLQKTGAFDRKEIAAPELERQDRDGKVRHYTFSSKAEILGALLHTGNESNKKKLLVGRQWGSTNDDGSLNSGKWDTFIARMQREGVLTKADYDFVQAVWDLLEEIKPQAQVAHKQMYGFYFNEVTADQFSTPYGVYRGGYVPAVADLFISEDGDIRNEKESLEKLNNSFMFPTTGRGFTKKRVEQYATPLSIDLRMIPGHIDKVMRFVHVEPHVKAVSRVVMDKGFRGVLAEFDPMVGKSMLVPWLQRSAQQKTTTPSKDRGADRFFRWVRTRASQNAMFLNVVNALQQVTGFSISAVKVKPRYLRNALWAYVKAPRQTAESIADKSKFMKARLDQEIAYMQHHLEELLTDPTKFEKARAFADKHAYVLQAGFQNTVDVVTWLGAYNEAIETGGDDIDAVRSADSAVRQTQGSLNAEDVSRFETGTPFQRLFTMFYSYFNMQANLMGTEFIKVARDMGLKKGAGRGIYVYVMGFAIPAVMSELIVRAMSAEGIDADDDDQYLDDVMDAFFMGQFRTVTAMFPGAGSLVAATFNRFNNRWYDDRITTSPAVSIVESAAGAPYTVYKAMFDDGNKKRATRDALSLIGILTGLPTAALARPAGYLVDVSEGETVPEGPVDFTRGIVTGR